MGKQKNLAIQDAEIANEAPKSTPQAVAPRSVVVTDGFLIREPLLKAWVTYLESRPYGEAKNLINSLSSLPRSRSTSRLHIFDLNGANGISPVFSGSISAIILKISYSDILISIYSRTADT